MVTGISAASTGSVLISIMHRFRDITTVTVYVTVCDLEKSVSFDSIVKITNHVRLSIRKFF